MNVKRDENKDTIPTNITHEKRQSAHKNGAYKKSINKEDEETAIQLRESEERFRLMFEQANVGMAFASLQGKLFQVNQGYCDITGHSREELLNHSLMDITHPDDVEKNVNVLQQLLQSEIQTGPIEKRYVRRDGSFVWANVSISLIRNLQEVPLYYMAVVIDISERKRLEEERNRISQQEQLSRQQASQSERIAATQANQLETVFASMVDGVFVYDHEGNILRANAAMREMLALDARPDYFDLPSATRLQLIEIGNEQGEPLARAMQPVVRVLRGEVLKGPTAVDATIRSFNGRVIQINVSGAPLRDAQGQITGGTVVVRDVTARRRLEHRTQASLEGLLRMAEALVQLPGHIEDANEMQATGRRLVELTRDILDCQRVGLFIIEPKAEYLRPLNVVGLSFEQEVVWWQEQQIESLQLWATKILERLQKEDALILDVTQPHLNTAFNPYDRKVILITPMRLEERIIGLLMLDYGAVEHTYTQSEIALATAIGTLSALVIERQRLLTEQAEARGREVALQEANRRMEDFLGIASHELRTPLTTIKANIQLTKRRLHTMASEPLPAATASKVESMQEMLSRAERQVGVLNRLVGDLIDISRIQTGKLQLHLRTEPSDLAAIVTEAVQEQRKATPKRTISLSLPPDDNPLLVIADADRLSQVLTNYMTNALKYSDSDKPVAVLVTREKGAAGEDEVRVSVRDEGPGLSSTEQERIWECFYQSEDVKVVSGSGVGLGLGLYITQTIVERHHGRVGVDSTPGVGSTFWFTLPLVQENFVAVEEE